MKRIRPLHPGDDLQAITHLIHAAWWAPLPCAGQSVGRALHDAALNLAVQLGARTLALDTAAPAAGLIALYTRWGYRVVGEVDWRPHTNYTSVVMTRAIADPALEGTALADPMPTGPMLAGRM